jgi:hypothetical protein
MALNPNPLFPAAGAYVLTLHRDAQPEAGLLLGRIHHVASGDSSDFAGSDALIEWLTRHAAQTRTEHGSPQENR